MNPRSPHRHRPRPTPPSDARSEHDGAVAVEFALVALLFIALLYGLLVFGLIFGLNHTMTHAASEGARAALTAAPDSDPDAVRQKAVEAAEDRMSWLPAAKMPDAVATLDPCGNDPDEECITVTVTYDYAQRPLIPNLPGLGVVVPDEMVRRAVLQVSQ